MLPSLLAECNRLVSRDNNTCTPLQGGRMDRCDKTVNPDPFLPSAHTGRKLYQNETMERPETETNQLSNANRLCRARQVVSPVSRTACEIFSPSRVAPASCPGRAARESRCCRWAHNGLCAVCCRTCGRVVSVHVMPLCLSLGKLFRNGISDQFSGRMLLGSV